MKPGLIKKTLIVIATVLLVCVLAILLLGEAMVRKGNMLYRRQKYNEATEAYRKAMTIFPDTSLLYFDIGTSLYRKRMYRDAASAFSKALKSGSKQIEEKALYNIANCRYKLAGLPALDAKKEIRMYKEALDYYTRAADIDNNDADARFNRDLVQRKIKELLEGEDGRSSLQKRVDRIITVAGANAEEPKHNRSEKHTDIQEQRTAGRRKLAGSEYKRPTLEAAGSIAGLAGRSLEKPRPMSAAEAERLLNAYENKEAVNQPPRRRQGYQMQGAKDW